MANQITVARDLLVSALRDTTVGTAAGVNTTDWADTDQSVGHVFKLASPGAVNRGRLPVMNVIFSSDSNDFMNDEGGIAQISFDVEVIVGGVTGITTQELAESIMSAGENALRNAAGNYWEITDSSGSAYEKGPMWTKLIRNFTAEVPWEKSSV